MEIEIVTIGDEILSGAVINTNAAYIGQRLLEAGFKVSRQFTVCDEAHSLKEGLKEALGRSQIVIATGGLGPTCDDLTKDVAAEIFSSDLHFSEKVAEDLKKRFKNRPISLEQQATIPDKANFFLNSLGTAPGLIFKDKNLLLILLPGVPQELQAMVDLSLIPYLLQYYPPYQKIYQKKATFALLSESEVDPFVRDLKAKFPSVALGIYPEHGVLKITCTGEIVQEVDAVILELREKYKNHFFESPSSSIEEMVHILFSQNKKTLAFAESMTGGMLSKEMVKFAGASNYFLGSCVAYSNALKQSLLHVPKETIEKYGAVSEQTVLAMLEGIFKITEAEYGIAVTGIAGLAGDLEDKSVGTVWGAISARNQEPFAEKFFALGNRQTIILYSCRRLLFNLVKYMQKNEL